jgi:deazaflavin-dependent oxidoreductase (nitroreductase family)
MKTKPKPKGLDRPATTHVIKLMSNVHTRMYRATGGRLGKNWRIGSAVRQPVPVCLLTTIGRKSGQPRTVPLVFMRDGANIVLVASKGGLPDNPQWYGNVKVNPAVEIEIGKQRSAWLARAAKPEERARLWPQLVEMYEDFASYQTWTDREIPVVICEPVD